MTDRNTISQVVESLFEDWIDKNINVHPLAVENMRILEADALALLKEQEEVVRCKDCKWWDKKDDSNYGYCHACKHGYHSDHWEIGIYRTYKGDWFCADGERKE